MVVLPSSPLLGVAAFSHVVCWVVLFGFTLPFGWCCCFFLLLLGGAAWSPPSLALFPLSFCVVLLGFFPLWVVSPVWWCCLPSPPLGSGAFLPSSVGWCCLVSSPFWWCCCFSFSCLVVLPSFSSFGWRAPPKGGEGRQHHLTRETQRGKKPSSTTQKERERNTTQRGNKGRSIEGALHQKEKEEQQHHPKARRRPSSTTQQKTRETHHYPKEGMEGSTTQQEKEKATTPPKRKRSNTEQEREKQATPPTER